MSLRVLIAAENASTRFGGEAILPYHYFRLLRARGIDAHLITHARTRAELEALFPDQAAHLHFVPDQLLQKVFYRLAKLLPHRLAEATFGLANQLLTQRAQRPILRSLVTAETVIHQPIPVAPRFPSLLHSLGAPVVIGPMNGGMSYPPAFRSAESIVSRTLIATGRTLSDVVNRLLPGKRRASILLVANERTRVALPPGLGSRAQLLVENAVDTTQWLATPAPAQQSSFVFIGRLVDWKALDIAFEALAQIPEASLDIIGDGPMRAPWQQLTQTLGIASRVRFHGWLSQADCAQHLKQSRALLLPSLYECGGAVVLEAMASARPVIATAWGGPADYLDATCGFLIAPTSRAALVAGFAQSMQILLHTPGLGQTLGLAGRTRLLAHFTWASRIDQILALYKSIQARP